MKLRVVLIVIAVTDCASAPAPILPTPVVASSTSIDPRPTPSASIAAIASAAPVASASASSSPPLPACPPSEVWIPPTPTAGFEMGRSVDRYDTRHHVVLTRGFCIDANEVTAGDFEACVNAKKCAEPWRGDPFSTYGRHADHPVNMVSWVNAHAYCEWNGKRLPTEAEWEWTASGPDGTKWPWGNSPDPSCESVDYTLQGAPKWAPGGDVGCGGGGPSAVGSHPKGDRVWPGGAVHDLAGNVWEWTEDSFEPYTPETQTDPLVRRESAVHSIRGGGWNRPATALTTYARAAAHYEYRVPGIGFRCARGEPHPTPPPRQKTYKR